MIRIGYYIDFVESTAKFKVENKDKILKAVKALLRKEKIKICPTENKNCCLADDLYKITDIDNFVHLGFQSSIGRHG